MKRASRTLSIAAMSAFAFGASISAAQESVPDRTLRTTSEPQGPYLFSDWVAQSTIVVAGSNFNDAMYSTPKGVGYDAIAALFIERPDGNFICSGALLSGGLNVLTAAHCLSNTSGVNITNRVTAVFFTPGQPASARELIVSSSTLVNPAYTGQVIDAHDVAIVKLGASPSLGILNAAYSLYLGNPFTTAQAVGSGGTGTGATGTTQSGGFTLADRRTGLNTINFSWTDPNFGGFFYNFFGSADPYSLVADFDSGLPANNSACILTGLSDFTFANPTCGLGFGTSEVSTGPGDSGGPLFIGNQIAGVASYGLSFGKTLGDSDNLLNSSFGEFAGWTSTAYNADWITQVTAVPEPGSFVLVGAGLFALATIAKRRKPV